jgi:heavy metal response regulator
MKILVVEDEAKLAAYLHKGLSEEGFVVDVANNGLDGLHLSVESDYDAVLLDRMLPGLDGLALLAALRRVKSTPVLMLSARQQTDDRVEGLRAGADDYLVKPFAFSELVARVHALLRRTQTVQTSGAETTLKLGELELDLLRRKATRAHSPLDLTTKELQLLELLLRRSGEVLSRTEIAERVWDMHFDSGTNVIDVAIRRLRSKLDAPFERPMLHTVRGFGYILEERDA